MEPFVRFPEIRSVICSETRERVRKLEAELLRTKRELLVLQLSVPPPPPATPPLAAMKAS